MDKISLKDWTLFSTRDNSTNYVSNDKKLLLKIANNSINGVSDDELLKEKELSDKALSIGVPTPKVQDVVDIVEGGQGIIYEYIENKKSVSRAISEDPDNIEKYIKRYVDVEKKIHSKICNTEKFDSIDDRLVKVIKSTDIYTTDEKNVLFDFVKKVKKSTNCLHVDCHMGNVILSDKGDYAIDLGLMAYGNELYDIGVIYLFTHVYINEEQLLRMFHMDSKTALKCWDIFVEYYFGLKNSREKEEFEQEIKKYALLGFLSHAVLLPLRECQVWAKNALFNDAFK